jgi:hypothetical protein
MRLWLKDSERRPDPLPARANARKALFVGTLGWLAALGGVIVFQDELAARGLGWWFWCSLIGVALGIFGLAWVWLRRH